MILETERLILRDFDYSDIDDVVDGLNNINISKFLAYVPYPYTKEDAKEYIDKTKNSKDYAFAIVLKSENKVIGNVTLSNINKTHGIAGGGIWINEKYHGHGYGIEAFNKRIDFAFNTLGLRRLENGYFKGNEASKHMQEKLGYKYEGCRRKRFVCRATSKIEDEVINGLLKEEWLDISKKEE